MRDIMPTTSVDTSAYKLHCKNVGRGINLDAVRALPVNDPKKLADLEQSLPWLIDPARYDDLPLQSDKGVPQANLEDSWIEQMLNVGHIRRIDRKEIRGWVRMFPIAEHAKQRFRLIKFTKWANDFYGKESLRKLTMPTKVDIVRFVRDGSHFIMLDFSAWFDQLPYHPDVGTRFCFRNGPDDFYCLNRLAMGQRPACEVAQGITELLLDFPGKQSKTAAVIDNVIFVGSEKQVVKDAVTFLQRARAVGAVINEFDVTGEISEKTVAPLVVQQGDWCGVRLDTARKEVRLTEKTLDKVVASWKNRPNWSWRQFAAHVGLLFWSWMILDVPIHDFYPLLRFISEVGRFLTANEDKWDSPAVIWDSAIDPLTKWTDLLRANAPRQIFATADPTWIVATDASAGGWGYCAFNALTGDIRTHGQRWTYAQLRQFFKGNANKVKKSVYSEPLAVVNSLCHLLKGGSATPSCKVLSASDPDLHQPEGARTKILLGTDNSAAMHTMNRGFASRSFDINRSIQELKTAFPASSFDIELRHIPGKENPADYFSRLLHLRPGANNGNFDIQKLHRMLGVEFRPDELISLGNKFSSPNKDLQFKNSKE